ncbi:putative ABC transporter ATP-binding protein [Ceratocystis fimbriata CBS 114723]|uniref:Putative ABC transporter ATP-binding protein n=1 Tax=Ceratocystis fimbriata CBS 114723 TaxID=1035309 RepID=A0A2C5XB27_9PEZI|nr:putative ABC transporter ATP-binding protein [Ceratocystis fimbriata CBS 114723]
MRVPPPIVRITNGTFFRHQLNAHGARPNPPLFPQLSFTLPATAAETWAVVGPSLSGKTTFLQVLRGLHLSDPPTSREFPYLSTDAVSDRLRSPIKAIQYVGFDADAHSISANVTTSAYLSARYESRREETDFSLRDYLLGNTELNPSQPLRADAAVPVDLFGRVVADLRLEPLLDLPVAFLSNGQGRRARIARAILERPEVLLLDEPFMGLDPPTTSSLSPLLHSLAARASPRLVISGRPQDPVPEWITHMVLLADDCRVEKIGARADVLGKQSMHKSARVPAPASPSTIAIPTSHKGTSVVEMRGCKVRYGSKIALGNWPAGLHWTVRQGERWAVFGPNGSGKTTVVALLCSDHPQTYALPIKLFGRTRLPQPGSSIPPLTFWDVQARIGHSSPEVHQHMPRRLSLRQVLASAWAPTFAAPPVLDAHAEQRIQQALQAFERELNSHGTPSTSTTAKSTDWADEYLFGQVSFSAQRVALLLRAVIKSPEIVVLDEAFSGMDAHVREKCMRLLRNQGEAEAGIGGLPGLSSQQALICISHIREEVPDSVGEWMCLPEANSGREARFGRLERPLGRGDGESEQQWREIWDM